MEKVKKERWFVKMILWYDDFFRWTKHELPEGLILNGRITRFDNDLVIRYLENVTVLDDGLEVKFKAGITVKV